MASDKHFKTLIFRAGSNPFRVIDQLRNKLKHNAAAVQVPIGSEDALRGVVDIVRMKAIYNEGVKGYVWPDSRGSL